MPAHLTGKAPGTWPCPPFGHRLHVWDLKFSLYLYMSLFFLLFAPVGLFPLVCTFWVSLHDWHLLKGQGEFVSLANFTNILQEGFFWNSLGNTMNILLLSATPQLIGALFIATVLDQNLRAKTFWRMSMRVLLPYIVTPVAVGEILANMFGEDPGGPQRNLQTTVLYLWEMGFQRNNFGKASAIAWLLFLIIVIIGLVNLSILKRIASADTKKPRAQGKCK
ncbi:hypothetical protein QBC39DRAFT_376938 [Podospora conica]|nr:hypothetical protein QBC39DRAFT_376938 [Schizothecium conicum]